MCHLATYATSSQVLPAVQRAGVPVLVLNLQPAAALDYERTDTGEWWRTARRAARRKSPTPSRARRRAVSNGLRNVCLMIPRAWTEIDEWCAAAGVSAALRSSRIGFLGHTYPGMLDMYSDLTMVTAQAGPHIEVLEMCDLQRCVEQVTEAEINQTESCKETFTLEKLSA